jgi:hypothetical protein
MNRDERDRLIARYAAGADEITAALDGFPAEQMGAHPVTGKWSAAEIIHHLADSESMSALRLRRLIAEDKPIIQGYDQALFAERLRYNERPIGPSLDLFRAARSTTVQVLRLMSDSDWTRDGWHTEGGHYTPEIWLGIYAEHAHNHAAQIRRLREALAK